MKVTKKNLLKTFSKLSENDARLLVRYCNGTLDPSLHPVGAARVSECYHRPDDTDLTLSIANSMLDGCGVEGAEWESGAIYSEDYISYVNRGDTYTVTLLWSPDSGEFEISDWGSIYEQSPAFEEAHREENEEENEEESYEKERLFSQVRGALVSEES